MKKNPFFSIIIPTFNQCNFLEKNLKSIFSQTYNNFEIIVVDNFSTDLTYDIIQKYKKKLKYFKIRNNGIIAKSRNYGLRKAKGKWVAFLDSDDYWTTNKLKVIHNYIKKNYNFNVICNDEWKIKNNKKIKISKYGPFHKEDFYKYLLLKGNCISTSASFIEKKFLKKNNIFFVEKKNYVTAEDYDLFLKIALCKGNFFFLNKILGYHTYHDNSASNNTKKHFMSINTVIRDHVFYYQKFTNKKNLLFKNLLIQYKLKLFLVLFEKHELSLFSFFINIIMSFAVYPKITSSTFLYIFKRYFRLGM